MLHDHRGLAREVPRVAHVAGGAARDLPADEDHLAAAQPLRKRAGEPPVAGRRGHGAGQRRVVLAAHGDGVDLDEHARIREIWDRHRRERGCGARTELRPEIGEEGVLVDAAVVHVERHELDEVVERDAELAQHRADVIHNHAGLGLEIVVVQDEALDVLVDLTADVGHAARPDPVLVRHRDQPAPVPLRPRVRALHSTSWGAPSGPPKPPVRSGHPGGAVAPLEILVCFIACPLGPPGRGGPGPCARSGCADGCSGSRTGPAAPAVRGCR